MVFQVSHFIVTELTIISLIMTPTHTDGTDPFSEAIPD